MIISVILNVVNNWFSWTSLLRTNVSMYLGQTILVGAPEKLSVMSTIASDPESQSRS
jgi:hypothetical protein